jgi:hypothetical protein
MATQTLWNPFWRRGATMARAASIMALLLAVTPRAPQAQQWNDARVRSLVQLATERRAQQLADSGLMDYRALAHGYLTFLAQLGEGFREPPRVVKADELALEVYWRAPNLSKQVIVGRRDTTLLPTDIAYHRDHLGIVQNNFPSIIRLGDGDEVRDVPHPLSGAGLAEYDFAIADSLRMSLPDRVISVYEVKVRPRDDRQARVIGALYLDRDNGQVVRMSLSFTRAAFLDRQLEDLFVVLENGLVGARFWLPRRQEIEIRRSATWLDYPVRGIIRGRWEITGYDLNVGLPESRFAGPEIVVSPTQRQYPWPSRNILDSLPPDIRAVTAEETRRVQAEVRALVREQALQRARGSALAIRGVSDLARFNRVEGLALGSGVALRPGRGLGVSARGRFGLDDRAFKSHVAVTWERASGAGLALSHFDEFREVGELAERSLLLNSFAAQEFGSDHTDPFRVRGVSLSVTIPLGATRWAAGVARENHAELHVAAFPARGTFRGTPPAAALRLRQASLRMTQPTRLAWLGTEARADAEFRVTHTDSTLISRASVVLELERPVADSEVRVLSRTIAAGAHGSRYLHVQDLVFLGGPVSVPGYDTHSLPGRAAIAQRIEMRAPVPFLPLSLGRFGRSPARAILAPHASIAILDGVPPTAGAGHPGNLHRVQRIPSGAYRSAGISVFLGFDLLRLDVSRGLDAGGRWSISVDVNRAFWSVL